MAISYQMINEVLAKGTLIEAMPAKIAEEVVAANTFLLQGQGEQPIWLEDFLESNRCKLVETICRATSKAEGISSLSGYNEGYFNEIVQNANDLQFGDEIWIEGRRIGSVCQWKCRYKDRGFELSNLYAFLNREMSDKSMEDGQTGKFGVGIKSFFKFVHLLQIESNVRLEFSIQNKLDEVTGKVSINSSWDYKTTELSFEYDTRNKSEFNTKKLTDLLDYLCGNTLLDVKKCFVTGKDSEIVFDLCSLIFMKGKGKKENTSISKIVFQGSCHQIEISCRNKLKEQKVQIEKEIWLIKNVELEILLDKESIYQREYLIFSKGMISFGFPVEAELEEYNRFYSTYYLKTDRKQQILPISMLIDTKFSNIHRTDIGENEEQIQRVYQLIKEEMQNLYRCMCSKQISNQQGIEKVSDIFYSLLARYLSIKKEERMESPFHQLGLNTYYLPKLIGDQRPYVVVHQVKEKYELVSYMEGDIVKELKESYLDFVEKKQVIDFDFLIHSERYIMGVNRLYTLIQREREAVTEEWKENIETVIKIVNFFENVGSFFSFVITRERRNPSSVTDAEVDQWLIQLKKEIGTYFKPMIFLKLIGRYQLNQAIDFDGSIKESQLSFKDYLFNGILELEDGILTKYQNKQYNKKYAVLKEELLKKRYIDRGNIKNKYQIRCFLPCGNSLNRWDGTYHYDSFDRPFIDQVEEKSLSEPLLFLEKITTDSSFQGMIDSNTMRLFEKQARGMRKREYLFKSYITREQQIIDLSCLKSILFQTFSDFIKAIQYRKQLDYGLAVQIRLLCKQERITTQSIKKDLLPILLEAPEKEKKRCLLEEWKQNDVEIGTIIEDTNNEALKENREFIFKITGYQVHIYHFQSNTKKKVIAYFGKETFSIRTEASKPFLDIAFYQSKQKEVFIFYDHFSENLQEVITIVLSELGIAKKILELLQGYIYNGNQIKTINYLSRQRNIKKVQKKLQLDWCQIHFKEIPTVYENEILYRLLTARGSYDIFCPICADIPMETFDSKEESKNKHNRRIIVLENENEQTKEKVPYIVTVACFYCFEKLKSTLERAEFDGKNLILTTQMMHGQHERIRHKYKIELSPINLALISKFKL